MNLNPNSTSNEQLQVDWDALEAQWTTLSNTEEFCAPLFQRVMLHSWEHLSANQNAAWIPRAALSMLLEAASYAGNSQLTDSEATASRYAALLLLNAVRKGCLPADGILSGDFDCDGVLRTCTYDVRTGDLSSLTELVILLQSFDL